MLFTTMWAYETTYKVTTQATPFELVYGTQPVMLVQFIIWIKLEDDIQLAIQVRKEELVKLDEKLLAC
jgi:hypothetical protein